MSALAVAAIDALNKAEGDPAAAMGRFAREKLGAGSASYNRARSLLRLAVARRFSLPSFAQSLFGDWANEAGDQLKDTKTGPISHRARVRAACGLFSECLLFAAERMLPALSHTYIYMASTAWSAKRAARAASIARSRSMPIGRTSPRLKARLSRGTSFSPKLSPVVTALSPRRAASTPTPAPPALRLGQAPSTAPRPNPSNFTPLPVGARPAPSTQSSTAIRRANARLSAWQRDVSQAQAAFVEWFANTAVLHDSESSEKDLTTLLLKSLCVNLQPYTHPLSAMMADAAAGRRPSPAASARLASWTEVPVAWLQRPNFSEPVVRGLACMRGQTFPSWLYSGSVSDDTASGWQLLAGDAPVPPGAPMALARMASRDARLRPAHALFLISAMLHRALPLSHGPSAGADHDAAPAAPKFRVSDLRLGAEILSLCYSAGSLVADAGLVKSLIGLSALRIPPLLRKRIGMSALPAAARLVRADLFWGACAVVAMIACHVDAVASTAWDVPVLRSILTAILTDEWTPLASPPAAENSKPQPEAAVAAIKALESALFPAGDGAAGALTLHILPIEFARGGGAPMPQKVVTRLQGMSHRYRLSDRALRRHVITAGAIAALASEARGMNWVRRAAKLEPTRVVEWAPLPVTAQLAVTEIRALCQNRAAAASLRVVKAAMARLRSALASARSLAEATVADALESVIQLLGPGAQDPAERILEAWLAPLQYEAWSILALGSRGMPQWPQRLVLRITESKATAVQAAVDSAVSRMLASSYSCKLWRNPQRLWAYLSISAARGATTGGMSTVAMERLGVRVAACIDIDHVSFQDAVNVGGGCALVTAAANTMCASLRAFEAGGEWTAAGPKSTGVVTIHRSWLGAERDLSGVPEVFVRGVHRFLAVTGHRDAPGQSLVPQPLQSELLDLVCDPSGSGAVVLLRAPDGNQVAPVLPVDATLFASSKVAALRAAAQIVSPPDVNESSSGVNAAPMDTEAVDAAPASDKKAMRRAALPKNEDLKLHARFASAVTPLFDTARSGEWSRALLRICHVCDAAGPEAAVAFAPGLTSALASHIGATRKQIVAHGVVALYSDALTVIRRLLPPTVHSSRRSACRDLASKAALFMSMHATKEAILPSLAGLACRFADLVDTASKIDAEWAATLVKQSAADLARAKSAFSRFAGAGGAAAQSSAKAVKALTFTGYFRDGRTPAAQQASAARLATYTAELGECAAAVAALARRRERQGNSINLEAEARTLIELLSERVALDQKSTAYVCDAVHGVVAGFVGDPGAHERVVSLLRALHLVCPGNATEAIIKFGFERASDDAGGGVAEAEARALAVARGLQVRHAKFGPTFVRRAIRRCSAVTVSEFLTD